MELINFLFPTPKSDLHGSLLLSVSCNGRFSNIHYCIAVREVLPEHASFSWYTLHSMGQISLLQ